MEQATQVTHIQERSVIADMAMRFGMDKDAFQSTVIKSVFPKAQATNEQLASFLLVAREYELNPFTKEIYAFPANGGIQPIVSIDGWLKIINSQPQFNGMQFKDNTEDGRLVSVTCQIYRKDREHATEVTEYMTECARPTEPWKKWPARMLRHKATIQAARYAFGFSGIMDPDEADRLEEVQQSRVVDMGAAEVIEDCSEAVEAIHAATNPDELLAAFTAAWKTFTSKSARAELTEAKDRKKSELGVNQ